MNSAGIVRRIDELGRIVIPKELRRTMRLHEGDEMEIIPNGDTLTVRRYSGFESALSSVRAISKLLYETTDADVLFVTPALVVSAEGKRRKYYADAKLSDKLSELVRDRRASILHGDDLEGLFEGKTCECSYLVLEPIVVNGDLVGAAVLLMDALPSDIARAYLGFCAQLLSAVLA